MWLWDSRSKDFINQVWWINAANATKAEKFHIGNITLYLNARSGQIWIRTSIWKNCLDTKTWAYHYLLAKKGREADQRRRHLLEGSRLHCTHLLQALGRSHAKWDYVYVWSLLSLLCRGNRCKQIISYNWSYLWASRCSPRLLIKDWMSWVGQNMKNLEACIALTAAIFKTLKKQDRDV